MPDRNSGPVGQQIQPRRPWYGTAIKISLGSCSSGPILGTEGTCGDHDAIRPSEQVLIAGEMHFGDDMLMRTSRLQT